MAVYRHGAAVAVTIVIGELRQVATVSNPTSTPDGDGGYTETWAALDPAVWRCAIEKASVKAAERHFSSTVIAHGSYILTGRFHAGITAKTRVQWTDRSGTVHTANVLDIEDTEGAGVETVLLVMEIVP